MKSHLKEGSSLGRMGTVYWGGESASVESLKCVCYVLTFSNYQLNAQFLYSSTISMLHYDPQHVSSSTLLILRRTNCITTASGNVTLCIQPYALNLHTVRLYTEGYDTRGCKVK